MRKRSDIYIENESRWSDTRQDMTKPADLVAAVGSPPPTGPPAAPCPARPQPSCCWASGRADSLMVVLGWMASTGCSAHPPVSQFEQTGLETSACRTNFIKKVWVVWDLVWNKQKRNNSCLRRTISKQGPYILLHQGTSQVMNVGLPWPFQETLTLTGYRQINTQQ